MSAVVWEIPSGRVSFGVTRMTYRVQRVTVLGPVPFEPGMVRVRLAGGAVVRALREHLRPVDEEGGR
ncbi:hypothetical protein [Knoellia koreensis]|uniref:Uncharacterized protein n=1 Tax=Knoellia koreensis TaxID=2730921 RepID=A0A849H406_9MICO|nr:hypothetical protein [Knoellia sp. DB2414S]NNM44516.1 hypothetical protein [Knoellia sp. DB2414S]